MSKAILNNLFSRNRNIKRIIKAIQEPGQKRKVYLFNAADFYLLNKQIITRYYNNFQSTTQEK